MAGDLENLAMPVEVDGIDGEAHEAHVNAVARCDEQGRGGRQGALQHEAAQARQESIRNLDLQDNAAVGYRIRFHLHNASPSDKCRI